MDKIQRHSAASLDETRVEYILAAVDSARQIFPSHVIKKKNAAEEKHHSSTKLSGEDISVAVNGQLLEEWTEEDTTNVNGFMEKRVSIFSVDGKYILPHEITGTISRDKKMMATSISKTLASAHVSCAERWKSFEQTIIFQIGTLDQLESIIQLIYSCFPCYHVLTNSTAPQLTIETTYMYNPQFLDLL